MGEVRLLDCTLRDGGHINKGKFGKKIIKAILSDLVKAKVDIIEAGFLWDSETDEDTARFESIKKLKRYLPQDMGNSKISLMADNVDLSNLEPYDGTVEFIRLSFRKTEFEWAEKTALELKDKGYKVYINPIHCSSFTDQEYLEIIERVNKLKPYGFSIVDTFGAMRQSDLGRIYYIIEHNLDKDIVLGVHLHENLGLAYSLAQHILKIASPTRNITIDGSLYGMGKVPGNLCIEQMMDYLNNEYNTNYPTEPVYDAIDDYIMPIYEKSKWGYSVPYALSAQCGVHRTYAEYLINKERLHTKDIRRLLNTIKPEFSEIYNEKYIELLYRNYMLTDFNDDIYKKNLSQNLEKYNKIIVIAPGSSLSNFTLEKELLHDACVITINFIYEKIKADFQFFSNTKRLGYVDSFEQSNLIITSNLINDVENANYIISRNELSYHDDIYCDDSTLMLLNLLKICGKKNIFLIGFDGFKKNQNNFYEPELERKVRDDDYDSKTRIDILKKAYSSMNIKFLTPSLYMEDKS
jgi:4-hydroxy 2-oxovalerate aldolase